MCSWWMVEWVCFFFFKQKTAYELRISDWSSDVCSSDLEGADAARALLVKRQRGFGDAFKATDTGTDHRAGAAFFFFGGGMPVGVVQGLRRGGHGEDDEIVNAF